MAFPERAAAGILSPAEFLHLKNIYNTLADEDWFEPSMENRRLLASIILNTFRSCSYPAHQLPTICRMKAFDAMEVHHDNV